MVRHARISWNPRDDRHDPYADVRQRDPKPIPLPKRRKRKPRREPDPDADPDQPPEDDVTA